MLCIRSLVRLVIVGVGVFMLLPLVLGLGSLSAGEQRKIYWIQSGSRTIQRANLDGSNMEDIITLNHAGTDGIALDRGAGKIYWSRSINGGSSGIQRANLDGSQVEDVVFLEDFGVAGIALDPTERKLYWVDRRLGQIERVDFDGSSRERIVTAEKGSDIALDLSSRKLYWSSRALQTIHRANLDGTGVVNLVRVGVSPDRIALDVSAGKIYWTDSLLKRIERANLDGSDIEALVVGQQIGGPTGLTLDVGANKLYWTHSIVGTIQRANLDGSNVETIVTLTRQFPGSMAIEQDCNGNGLPDHTDITNGISADCNANGLPDECEPDCNANGIADPCDTAAGTSADCTGNRIPDECEPDCNGNGIADSCDVADGRSEDCNLNGIPDVCDVRDGNSEDCNANGIADECDFPNVICLLPVIDDGCDGKCPRYFFNACTEQCEMFISGCCQGLANDFSSIEECGAVCGDKCPNDPNKTGPGTCGCGVPDDADADGDGVPDCVDLCPEANDVIFAPECNGAIPTVSAWGLTVMVLVLLVTAKTCFARRHRA